MAGGDDHRPGLGNDFESDRPPSRDDVVDVGRHVSELRTIARYGRKSDPLGHAGECREDAAPGLVGGDAELGRDRLGRPPAKESKYQEESHLAGQTVEIRVERYGRLRSEQLRAAHALESIALDPVPCNGLDGQFGNAVIHNMDQLRQLKAVRHIEKHPRCCVLAVGAIARPAKAGPVRRHEPTLEDLGPIRVGESADNYEMSHRTPNYEALLRNAIHVMAARSWLVLWDKKREHLMSLLPSPCRSWCAQTWSAPPGG